MTTPLFERVRLRQQIHDMIQSQGADQAWQEIHSVIRSVMHTKYPYDAPSIGKGDSDLDTRGREHSHPRQPG
jgi:hypothetical protein